MAERVRALSLWEQEGVGSNPIRLTFFSQHFHARSNSCLQRPARQPLVTEWVPTSTGAPQRNTPQRDAHFGNAVRASDHRRAERLDTQL